MRLQVNVDAAPGRSPRQAIPFLIPAMVLFAAPALYPLVFSLIRSSFDASGDESIGLRKYVDTFAGTRTLTTFRNNVI